MLFEATFTRVGLCGQGMLMSQAKVLAADPSLEGRPVSPRGEDHIGRLRIDRAEHLQTHKARLLLDLIRPGSEPLLEWCPPGRGDRHTIGDNVHASLLTSDGGSSTVSVRPRCHP